MKSFVEQIEIARQRPTIEKYYVNINQFLAMQLNRLLSVTSRQNKHLDEAAEKSNKLLNQK